MASVSDDIQKKKNALYVNMMDLKYVKEVEGANSEEFKRRRKEIGKISHRGRKRTCPRLYELLAESGILIVLARCSYQLDIPGKASERCSPKYDR